MVLFVTEVMGRNVLGIVRCDKCIYIYAVSSSKDILIPSPQLLLYSRLNIFFLILKNPAKEKFVFQVLVNGIKFITMDVLCMLYSWIFL